MDRTKAKTNNARFEGAPARPFACPQLWAWLAAGALGSARCHVEGQEALRYSIASEAAAMSKTLDIESQPYTFKSGDFRALLSPSLGLQWNDNVYLSKNNAQDDFILTPLLNIAASYPISQRNLLQVNIGIGYNEYFNHHELSRLLLTSGSQVAFDIYTGDFRINLHDQFSYVQDSALEAAVANTGAYGTFQNTAGVGVTWDQQDLTVPFGFDHLNNLATSGSFDYTDHSTEMVNIRPGLKVHPQLTVGVEGTVSYTTYDQRVLNDNTGYTLGVYGDYRPGKYLIIQPRFGYSIYDYRQTSTTIPAKNQDSWYVDLTLSHQATRAITYNLSVGHELRLGIQSDLVEDWYFRPNIIWSVIKDVSITTSFFYENGTETGASLPTSSEGNYNWYGGSLGLGYSPTRNLNLSLNYRLTFRTSDTSYQEYTQNSVGILVAYSLQ